MHNLIDVRDTTKNFHNIFVCQQRGSDFDFLRIDKENTSFGL